MQSLVNNYRTIKLYEEKLRQNQSDFDEDVMLGKLKFIRETTEFLKYKLQREREELEKERWMQHNAPKYSLPNPHHSQMMVPMRQSFMPCSSYGSLQTPYYYQALPEWNQCYMPTSPRYTPYPYSIQCLPDDPRYIRPAIPIEYQGHLEDVDRQCEEELYRMQYNINNIRKINKYWRDYDSDAIVPERKVIERRVRRRIRRRLYYGDEY